jgi:hypothetical protein
VLAEKNKGAPLFALSKGGLPNGQHRSGLGFLRRLAGAPFIARFAMTLIIV